MATVCFAPLWSLNGRRVPAGRLKWTELSPSWSPQARSQCPASWSSGSYSPTLSHGEQGSSQSLSSFAPGRGSSSKMPCMGLKEILTHPSSPQHYSQLLKGETTQVSDMKASDSTWNQGHEMQVHCKSLSRAVKGIIVTIYIFLNVVSQQTFHKIHDCG